METSVCTRTPASLPPGPARAKRGRRACGGPRRLRERRLFSQHPLFPRRTERFFLRWEGRSRSPGTVKSSIDTTAGVPTQPPRPCPRPATGASHGHLVYTHNRFHFTQEKEGGRVSWRCEPLLIEVGLLHQNVQFRSAHGKEFGASVPVVTPNLQKLAGESARR